MKARLTALTFAALLVAASPLPGHAARRRLRDYWRYAHRRHHYRQWAYWRPFRIYWPHIYWSRIPWFGF